MLLKRLCVAGVVAALFQAVPASAEAGQAAEIYPLAKVKRGQTGYGLTTMKGTTPERFEFEVIGVAKNFLPKMDIILVKSDDPKLQLAGFWQGMSGSPLFLDGKLLCAFSYGFRFNKAAIGGCTPLEYMKHEGFKAPRRIDDGKRTLGVGAQHAGTGTRARSQVWAPRSQASAAEWARVAKGGRVDAALGTPRTPWLLSAALPPAPAKPTSDDSGLVASAVPLAMAGFSGPAFAKAKEIMADYPLAPMQAGGTGSSDDGPSEFASGAPIAVQLIRGDMSAAATGTVSLVDTKGVLAFGHPMFQAGELYAPVAAAEIHTVIPSAQSAFIMSSPLRELGSLVQDRQSCIMADTKLKTHMVPVDIYIVSGKGKERDRGEFHVEVLDNKFFTASLAGVATATTSPPRSTPRCSSRATSRSRSPTSCTRRPARQASSTVRAACARSSRWS
jgi:hypothetical protein